MRILFIVVVAAASLAWAQAKPGAKPAPKDKGPAKAAATLDGAKLFLERTCFACHGKDAQTPLLPEYPKLAGQNELYAFRQMVDIKSGARANGNTAAMKGVMFLVNEDEMKALATYLAGLK